MRRMVLTLVILLMAVTSIETASARRVVVRRTRYHRTTVVVHRGWPLRRAPRVVVVRPARVAVRVVPATYLAPVVFAPIIVSNAPERDVMVWEDGETLGKDEDWTEFTLDCDSRGEQLYLEVVNGRVQFDWAEVTFENGEVQVVDFAEKSYGTGLYSLLDFRDGRKVDHVRLVARARTNEARVVLKMRK